MSRKIDHDEFHELFNLIEERRLETDEKIMVLHKRITEGNEKLQKDISELKKAVEKHTGHEEECLHRIEGRLVGLEKAKWVIIGGGVAVAWLIINLEAVRSFFS